MNLSFKPWGISVLCGAGAFALASVMFMQGWLPVSSQAETATQTAPPAPIATPAPVATPVPATTNTPPAFTQAQLDQWVAPVALYPDSLLSQVLMASTYPTNVIQAVQWSRDHPQSQGDAAVSAVANEPWDPSVKSLVAFPQLLALMGEDPAWVQNLGDAFLAQPADVMDTVQKFRQVAQKSGALKSTPQQKVTVKPAAQSSSTTVVKSAPAQQTIIIESADPQVVYVPSYNPNVVYGAWPTPAYPPVYLPPPPGQQFVNGVVSGIGFGVGVAATYAIFGSIDWDDDHHHDYDHHDDHHDDGHHGGGQNNYVNVNVNNYNRISGNNNAVNHAGSANTAGWQHNAAFNAGTPTRPANLSGATQNRALNNAAQRNNYRGFDGSAVGRNNGGVQNQNLDQRRQQAASVMNSHPGFTPGQLHSSPRSVPASRPVSASDSHHVSGRQLPQHDALSHQGQLSQHTNGSMMSQRNGSHPQMENFRQGGNMTRSTAFSGNSSRAPSWQQQQARGDQSRRQMRDFQPARSAGGEGHHFQRR